MDDTDSDPVRAGSRAYRITESTVPSILDDGLLRTWFSELGIDPDLPPVAERHVPDLTS